jgi:hypothetical protein
MFAIIEYIYKFIDKFYFVLRIFLEIDRFLTPSTFHFQEKTKQWDLKSVLKCERVSDCCLMQNKGIV